MLCMTVCDEHKARFDGYGSPHAACVYSHNIEGHICVISKEKDRQVCLFESDCEECW